jgi:hypothetical protein
MRSRAPKKANSQSREFQATPRAQESFDLVLIDGDHSEEGCRGDFELVRDRARIIAFHDIVSVDVPGVQKVWKEVKAGYTQRFGFIEFCQQYPEPGDGFGIGLAISRGA